MCHKLFLGDQRKEHVNEESPPFSTSTRPVNERHSSPVNKIIYSRPMNERFMMGEHKSYHQAISGEEAERRLKQCGKRHCYLTRYSERQKSYILSIYEKTPNDVMRHFKIIIVSKDVNSRIYKIEEKDQEFESIDSLLAHYEGNRIDPALRSIGRAISKNPKKCIIL